jgi:hypothetical protein
MDIDARDLTVRAGDMKFAAGLGIMLVEIRALHALLYTCSKVSTTFVKGHRDFQNKCGYRRSSGISEGAVDPRHHLKGLSFSEDLGYNKLMFTTILLGLGVGLAFGYISQRGRF